MNSIILKGKLIGTPEYSHLVGNEDYFRFPLSVCRQSGNTDILNILIRRSLLESADIYGGENIRVFGEVRSYNNRSGEGSRLIISTLAREISFDGGEDENTVMLNGVVCKMPVLRRTPLGRQICDLMLAVPRKTGKSDYLPVITWGRTALEASDLEVGAVIHIEGRLQSRVYRNLVGSEYVDRTAYEVSASEFARIYEYKVL